MEQTKWRRYCKRQAWAVGKIWNNERDNETYNESGKKSDGQRHHMDFAETLTKLTKQGIFAKIFLSLKKYL